MQRVVRVENSVTNSRVAASTPLVSQRSVMPAFGTVIMMMGSLCALLGASLQAQPAQALEGRVNGGQAAAGAEVAGSLTRSDTPVSNLPPLQKAQPVSRSSMLALYDDALRKGDLSGLSDQNLTVLASYWGVLSATERRSVLAETRARMATSRTQVRRITIPRVRQYGKVIRKVRKIRQPDGTILVETQVVKVTPKGRSETRSVSGQASNGERLPQVTFGIGFEQRKRGQKPTTEPRLPDSALPAPATPPVMTVRQPPANTTP